jgi:hypothetical protein
MLTFARFSINCFQRSGHGTMFRGHRRHELRRSRAKGRCLSYLLVILSASSLRSYDGDVRRPTSRRLRIRFIIWTMMCSVVDCSRGCGAASREILGSTPRLCRDASDWPNPHISLTGLNYLEVGTKERLMIPRKFFKCHNYGLRSYDC